MPKIRRTEPKISPRFCGSLYSIEVERAVVESVQRTLIWGGFRERTRIWGMEGAYESWVSDVDGLEEHYAGDEGECTGHL
jgi:hypothetical protein